jgi:hypothetical protein
MKILKILILTFLLLLPGCDWLFNDDYEFEFDTIITDYPANLHGLNSDRDDYNSALPYEYQSNTIYFSSNYPTFGVNFDITVKNFEITYHRKKDNILDIAFPEGDARTVYDKKLFPLINTDFNEYGPFIFSNQQGWNYFFYANDEGGNLNIKFVYHSNSDWDNAGTQKLYGPFEAKVINSSFDDAYPTINREGNRMYFCSNRENSQFDIYSVILNASNIHDYLINSDAVTISKETVLSGSKNDKCPSITKNLLVFASDRDGGYGGYDLYYSLYADGQWSDPVNFGDKINSEYDEYRPITSTLAFLKEDLMVFSSNRPEGKGGYDLYCVKIGDLIENEWWQ